MRQIITSPFPSGGRNPVAEAVSPDQADLYVVNRDDNTIVQFIIGSDGKLYPQNTVNTPGIFPIAVAVSGNFLSSSIPISRCRPAHRHRLAPVPLRCFPILTAAQAGALKPAQPADTLGTPVVNTSISASYWPLTLPGGGRIRRFRSHRNHVAASGSYVYVAGYDSNTNLGYVFGFTRRLGRHAHRDSRISVSSWERIPSAITSDTSGTYLYVTDSTQNLVYGFQINGGH